MNAQELLKAMEEKNIEAYSLKDLRGREIEHQYPENEANLTQNLIAEIADLPNLKTPFNAAATVPNDVMDLVYKDTGPKPGEGLS